MLQLFWAAGGPAWSWQSYVAGPLEHPLGAWAGSRAVGNRRGSSPGHPDSEKPVRELGRSIHSLAKLVLAFLGCRPFLGGWCCLVLLCGSVAPPKGKQACAGTAPVVVVFRQLLRPALLDGRQPQVCESVGRGGGWGRGCTGKHSFLIAGRPVSSLWHGEYSMGAHPFFSPLPNTGTDPALLPGSL